MKENEIMDCNDEPKSLSNPSGAPHHLPFQEEAFGARLVLFKPPLVRGGGTKCRRGFLLTFFRPVFLVVHAADSTAD